MARIPGLRWRPIPENAFQESIVPTQWIVHTFVDSPSADLEDMGDYFERTDIGLESHTVLGWASHDQLVDTEVRADANYRANRRPDGTGAISTETEDDGTPVERPWNTYQLGELIRTGVLLHELHGIPAELCPTPDAPGMGYHSMFGAPSDWTPAVGKTCPGATRIKQFREIVLPGIQKAVALPPPTPELPLALQTGSAMLIIRRSNPNHRLLFLHGALFLAHDDRVTATAQTPTVQVGEQVWNYVISSFGPVIPE